MGGEHDDRRIFLMTAGAVGAGAVLAACASAAAAPSKAPGQNEAEEVSPVEDLMREHGVLRRVLLVYGEISRRAERQEPIPVDVPSAATAIIRKFIEDYHEKLEEEFVFPRFEKANKLVDLVTVLRQQHQAGRRLSDAIAALARPSVLQSVTESSKLVAPIHAFIRMYEPHAAREDTVLFPEFRPLIGAKEYEALGDTFEDKEHQLFGPKGFEGIVVEVAQLEKALGIHDLAQFTPP